MPAIFNHFWIMFIVVTVANGLIWKYKSKKYIEQKPELKESYDKLIKGWLIYGNIPWLIMAIGMLSGITERMDEFFNPKEMNPIVILFFISIIGIWIIGTYWIFFKKGAEKLVAHPGFITKTEKGNEKFETMKIKLLWIAGILGGIFGIYMMFNQDFMI